jgi:competence protein ComEC
MDILFKNERLERFRHGLTSVAHLFFDRFDRLTQAIHKRVLLEQDALSLWVPVAIGVGIALYFSLSWENYVGWTLVFLGSSAIGAVWLRHLGGLGILATTIFCVCLGFAVSQFRSNLVAAPVLTEEIVGARLQGQVINAGRNRQGGTTLLVAPMQIAGLVAHDTPARVRLKVSQEHAALWPGDEITTRVMLWPPAEPVAPGAFDFARQSWFRQLGGTGITLIAPTVLDSAPQQTWRMHLNRMREKVTRRILNTMDSDVGPVAAAMMTGQRYAIAEEVEQDLRDAGLAHILAISGLHMALFAGTLFWLVRVSLSLFPKLVLRYPVKKLAAALAVLGAFSYLLLSGMSVTTQRAFIMAGLIFLAVLLDRPAISLRNVALAAVIILLMTPESLLEPGFQMSFAAVTALIAVYQNRELQLLGFRERATGLSGAFWFAVIYVATLGLTSLVAGLATAPFAAFHFNRVAVYGIFGNLLAMPLVGLVIMPSALIAYLLMPFGLEGPALWSMELGLKAVLFVADEVSNWEGAITYTPSFSMLALGFITIGGLFLALLRTELRYAGLVLLAGGIGLTMIDKTPDILVEGDAKLVAVKRIDGTFVWSGSTPKYARETWLRRSGFASDLNVREHPMNCDVSGCVAEAGVIVAIARSAAALDDDCERAEVLIAFVPMRAAMRARCQVPLIIDRFDVAREGAHAIYMSNGNPQQVDRVETVRQWRGERPWTN